MTPLHLLARLPRIRGLGWAIAGTIVPFSLFALTSTPAERSPSPSSELPAASRPIAAHPNPALDNAHSGSRSPVPSLPPAQSRSPFTPLKNALIEQVERVAVVGVTSTAPDNPAASTPLVPASLNPFTLLRNSQTSPPNPSPTAVIPISTPRITQIPETSVASAGVPLTLQEAIDLTVIHNTGVKNAYLARIFDRAALGVARAELDPQLTPILTAGVVRDETANDGRRSETDFRARVSWFAPTGGTLNLDWRTDLNSFEQAGDRTIAMTYVQPLLRYGESTTARVNHRRALIREDLNLLVLRSTLSDEVTTTITTYRSLLLAQEQVRLTEASLENARAELQRQQALVAAGRVARYELLGVEQNVADFQSQLLGAQNNVQSAQLALMNQVGSDRDLNVVAVLEETRFDAITLSLDSEQIEQMSLAQRPDYLSRLLALKLAEIAKGEAANGRRWNLDLRTTYNRVLQSDPNWSATLTLTRDLGDRHRAEAAFKQAEVALAQQQNNLAQAEADIRIAVSNQIRTVRLQLEQLELAQEQVRLVAAELEAQEARQQAGRGSSFELQQTQRQLLDARNQELAQRIDYLNALTELENVQGITLERWGIRLEPDR
ncbi:MAG: TolC family protein [Cyanobacteria bacterium P01_G01_bin.54]